ncbi:hypothetical protein ACHAXS_001955 [Conticribra weissflogii]
MCSKSVAEIDVGVPPNAPSDWKTQVFHFHGFEHLPSKKGECTWTPIFRFCGQKWVLRLHPGGNKNSKDGYIALFLHHMSRERRIQIDYKFLIYSLDGNVAKEATIQYEFEGGEKTYGRPNFMKRSKIMSSSKPILKDGTLSISLMMRPTLGMPKTFIPPYRFANFMSSLFGNPKHADIMFVVQSTDTKEAEKSSYTKGSEESTEAFEVGQLKSRNGLAEEKSEQKIQIYAHRLVLISCAPGLATLCEPYANMTPRLAKSFERAYGCSGSLRIDSSQVGSRGVVCEVQSITSENALDLLQYAHAKTLPLLQEAVMKYLVNNKIEAQKIILSSDFFTASNTLIADLFGAMDPDKSTNARDPRESDSKYRAMDVDSLRREAYYTGMDFDRQQEFLVKSLEVKAGKKRKFDMCES